MPSFESEHRDIVQGGRKETGAADKRDRLRAELFYDLLDRTLERFKEAREEKVLPEEENSPTPKYKNPYRPSPDKSEERYLRRTRLQKMEQSLEFLFKKEWDKFIEPVVEHEEILATMMTKRGESVGAENRAFNAHKEAWEKAIRALQVIIPDIALMDAEKRKRILAQVYGGYTDFIRHEGERLESFASRSTRSGRYRNDLRMYLRSLDDAVLRGIVQEKELKKHRKKEERAKKGEAPRASPWHPAIHPPTGG